jgi:hypothetical protein
MGTSSISLRTEPFRQPLGMMRETASESGSYLRSKGPGAPEGIGTIRAASLRVLAILAIGVVLLTAGLIWTLGWLAISNPFVQPECCPVCFCSARTFRLLLAPTPLPLLLGYAIAVPSLMASGLRLARSGIAASKGARVVGWLLFGTMAAIGAYTLALIVIHPAFTTGTSGTTWLLLSIVAYLAAPALVLGSGGVLLSKVLRQRFTRRPPASAG